MSDVRVTLLDMERGAVLGLLDADFVLLPSGRRKNVTQVMIPCDCGGIELIGGPPCPVMGEGCSGWRPASKFDHA